MKYLFLFLSFSGFAQTEISYVSQNKDTLILPNDDLGYTIAKSWDNVLENKPKIIFAEYSYIHIRNRKKKEL